jgi:hypothetical protein
MRVSGVLLTFTAAYGWHLSLSLREVPRRSAVLKGRLSLRETPQRRAVLKGRLSLRETPQRRAVLKG